MALDAGDIAIEMVYQINEEEEEPEEENAEYQFADEPSDDYLD